MICCWSVGCTAGLGASGCRSNLSLIIDAVKHRVLHPLGDRGCPPSGASRADRDLFWERALLDLPVERRAAEPGALEHGVDPKDAIGGIGHHDMFLHGLHCCPLSATGLERSGDDCKGMGSSCRSRSSWSRQRGSMTVLTRLLRQSQDVLPFRRTAETLTTRAPASHMFGPERRSG